MIVGLVSTTANAAVVYWTTTDGNVNLNYSNLDSGYSLSLFDVDDFDGAQADPLTTDASGTDQVDFAPSGSDYTATSVGTNDSITLFGDDQFVIAVTNDMSTWLEPQSWTDMGGGFYDITFANGMVLSVDAVPHVVPVPPAVWLFGSGLLGLVGIARRKTA